MPFIGSQPTRGAYLKCDAITTSATASYTLQVNGGSVNPASANNMIVSLNGVIQAPQDAYTVTGSTITFDSALTSSDVIDFIMILGNTDPVGAPADGTITTNKLQNNAVTNTKIATGVDASKLTTGVLPDAQGGSQLVKLLDTNISSATNYDINNTYINSSYDSYKIIYNVKTALDNKEFLMQYFMTTSASGDAGSIISGNHHAYQSASMGSSTYKQNNTSSYAVIGHVTVGNATGEGINIVGTLMNVNDTTMLVSFSGTGSVVATNGAHQGFGFHTGMATPAVYGAYYCRGVRFYFGGGGTHTGRVKLFGIK
mgnify:CR=1 FL=1|tara:strand:+ start:562 stop:1500 length:939 start_codon:yes stop_codon:yes gene_type:complete